MKKLFLFQLVFFFTISLSGQNCETFVELYGNQTVTETGRVLAVANDGKIYVGANAKDSTTLLLCLAPDGELLWSKEIDFTPQPDIIRDLRIDSDGNLIGCGRGTQGNWSGSVEIAFAFKFNPTSQQLLAVRQAPEFLYFNIQEIPNSTDYLISGICYKGLGITQGDALLFRLDRTTLGVKANTTSIFHFTDSEELVETVIFENNIYATGRYVYMAGNAGSYRGSVTKFDLNGNEKWTHSYIDDLAATSRLYSSQLLIHKNNIYTMQWGERNDITYRGPSFFMVRTDMNGTKKWVGEYTSSEFSLTEVNDIKVDSDDFFYLTVTDYAKNIGFIIKLDKDGNVKGAKKIPNAELYGLELKDNKIIVVGKQNNDIYIAKLNKNLTFDDVKCIKFQDFTLNLTPLSNAADEKHTLSKVSYPNTGDLINLVSSDVSLGYNVLCKCIKCDVKVKILQNDTILVNKKTNVSLPTNVTGNQGTITYQWIAPTQGLSCMDCANPTFQFKNNTQAIVKVTDAEGCEALDTIYLQCANCLPCALIVTIDSSKVTIDEGNSMQVNTEVKKATGVVTYQWKPNNPTISCTNCPNPILSPLQNTTYYVTAQDEEGCIAIDSVEVRVLKCVPKVYIPNVFALGGTKSNSYFTAISGNQCVKKIQRIEVFSRWGELIFRKENVDINDETNAWDGTFRGKRCQSDVFVYVIVVEFLDNSTKLYKGDVTLIR